MDIKDGGTGLPIELPNFRFISVLGQGGMGTVYLGEQLNPRRKVAIKVVPPDDSVPRAFIAALKSEGNVAAQFDHDNLVHVYDCGVVNDHYYLAMQYLAGGDLDERIREGLSATETVRIIRSVACALGHIHSHGLVHRDVKPANILFNDSGKPVLADFGIAKDPDTVGELTSAGYSVGTPAYMAPEQIRGQQLDGRADLYALGVVLYQCLIGHVPFQADSTHELKEAQLHQVPSALPDELGYLQPILSRLLAKNPDERFASAEELVAALDDLGPHSNAVMSRSSMPTQRISAQPVADADSPSPMTEWVREMTGRRVFRVLAIYVALAWGLTEIVTGVVERLPGIPDWIATATTIAFVIGLPIVIALAWIYDLGPGGVKQAPTRRSGFLVVTVGLAAVISLTWVSLTYLLPQDSAEPRLTDIPRAPGSEAAVTSEPVLALLPFKLLGEGDDLEVLGQGMGDDLLHSLASLPGVRIKTRNAAATLAASGLSDTEIAQRLGATHLISASLERTGGQIRIRVSLLDTDNNLVWADRVEDSLESVYSLLQRIALDIGGGLGIEGLDEVERIERKIDPRAYALLAQARIAAAGDPAGVGEAIDLVKEVIALVPDYAEAHALLGWFYAGQAWTSGDREHPSLELAEAHLRLAQTIDPSLPQTDVGWALVYWWRSEWIKSYEAVTRYVESGDTDLLGEAAMTLNAMGYHREARDVVQRALAVDPLNPVDNMVNCLFSVNARMFAEALWSCEFFEEQGSAPDVVLHYFGVALLRLGNPPEIVRERLMAIDPGYEAMIDAVVDPSTRPDYLAMRASSDIPPMDLAYDYYAFGTPDQAEANAWQELDANRFNPPIYFMEPASHLRSRESFLKIMDAAGLVDLWHEAGPPDFCEPTGDTFVCR